MKVPLFSVIFAVVLNPLAALASDSSPDEPVFSFPSDFDRTDFEAVLHSEHPRLIAGSNDWLRIREQIPSSPDLAFIAGALMVAADELLVQPPLERIFTGRRMLFISREVLKRVLTLGIVYRLTDDVRYYERGKAELLTSAAFSDWNPSHFLDTAEMTLALAIGYDWFYHNLSETERFILQRAIVEKGLTPGRG